ncbi:MAG: Mrp/NBP35 family ATP-binding protein [Clostridiales bacterium]|nr:Mrp/NBP35 family ATP-binding protein [Clostridiales bacterium]
MANCTHDCSSCSSNCGSRAKTSLIKPLHKKARVKKVIAVASGKGGVGKSLACSLLAVRASALGYRAAVLDADITGPSIPKMFGVHERARGKEGEIYPVLSKSGIQLMSMNCLLEHEEDPVVWRGSLIAGATVQFWTDVIWDDVDIMFIDMPPGTGDVPLSVFQSIPVSGIVVVSTPQDLVEMIVGKAVKMARLMNVPILGYVENMSYLSCPDCGKTIEIFGKTKAEEIARRYEIPAYARIPIDPTFATLADGGKIENADTDPLKEVFEEVKKAKEIGAYTAE